MSTTPQLALPLLAAAQSQKHVTHNEALMRLDGLVQLAILGCAAAPPSDAAEGERWLVADGADGAWSGRSGQIAVRRDAAWDFLQAVEGWTAWNAAEKKLLVYTLGSWLDAVEIASPRRLGVNGAASEPYQFAVRGEATLLTHAGAGHRLVLNKASETQTASVVLQSNWSGRAEIGLCGQDRLSAKVSPDGAAWIEALRIESDGRVLLPRTTGFAQGVAPLDADARVPRAVLPVLAGDAGAGGASGLAPAPAAGDAAAARYLSAAGVWSAPPPAGRNELRNPSFLVNQRGVAGTVTLAAGQYGHDGLKGGAGGASYTVSPDGRDMKIAILSGSVIMPIEAGFTAGGVFTLAQDGTAAARVWQGAASGTFGSAARAQGGLVTAALDGAAQINVEFGAGTVVRPQFEAGLRATPFERRAVSAEQLLCRRYSQISLFTVASAFQFAAYNAAGAWPSLPVFLGTPMRATPTASLIGPWNVWNASNAGVSSMSPQLIAFYFQTSALGSAGMSNPAGGGFQLVSEL